MNFPTIRQWRILWQLLKRDLYIFRASYLDYMINTILWPVQAAVAFGYVFPLMGMDKNYGALIILATFVYKCLYESYFQSSNMVADINNLRSIDFIFTLPVTPWMIVLKNIVYFMIRCFALCAPILLISKAILQDRFPLDQWSPGLSLVAFFATTLFFALFTVWLAGWVKDQLAFEHVWVRFFDLLTTWGGFWFTWHTLYAFSPTLGYITLLNPFTLATEAIRASFFGLSSALAFWPCIGGLLLQAAMIGFIGYRKLKQRLDFVG